MPRQGISAPDHGAASDVPVVEGLVPDRSQLPDFPSTAELEAAAALVEPHEKASLFPGDRWVAHSLYPFSNAVPVFSKETDQLIGIDVAGLGTIDRSVYDTPGIDLEQLAVDKYGVEEYELRRTPSPLAGDPPLPQRSQD